MKKLEKFDGTKTYMFPDGTIATPAVMRERFPAVTVFDHIIETDEYGQVCYAVQNFAAMRSLNGIAAALTEDEAMSALETIINTVTVQQVSAEERIAAALEYQNIASMSDATSNS